MSREKKKLIERRAKERERKHIADWLEGIGHVELAKRVLLRAHEAWLWDQRIERELAEGSEEFAKLALVSEDDS